MVGVLQFIGYVIIVPDLIGLGREASENRDRER